MSATTNTAGAGKEAVNAVLGAVVKDAAITTSLKRLLATSLTFGFIVLSIRERR